MLGDLKKSVDNHFVIEGNTLIVMTCKDEKEVGKWIKLGDDEHENLRKRQVNG